MSADKVDPTRFERLLNPRSIAVFGGAQAQEAIRQCDLMGYAGEIWPVHPKADEVHGRKVYRSVDELPGSPDASYVGVNRNLTIDIIGGLAARDAGGAISYATGFAEAGEEGSELTRQLLEASGDMALVGPNCYGLLNYVTGCDALARPAGRPPGGPRRGHHHDVVERGVQHHHAAARPAHRLHGLTGQPAQVRPQRRDQDLRAPGRGHGDRALPGDDARPQGLPGGGRGRPRAGQAHRRGQDRALAGRAAGGRVAHRLAGRLRRAPERAVRAARRSARRLAGGAGRGAEAPARGGSARGRAHRRHEHVGRRPHPARRRSDPGPHAAAAVAEGR